MIIWFGVVQLPTCSSQSLGLQHARLSCPSPSPGACPNSYPLNQWCHPTISSAITFFSFCLQSFPASGSFPISELLEVQKKTLIGPWLLQWKQSVSLHIWCHQSPGNPSSCTAFMLNPHWGRAATGQTNKQTNKVLHLCTQGCFGPVQLFATLWTVACQASLLGEFARQEYWNVLANTGCHTLLEHYICCCSSSQLPWVPGAARTPVTQTAAPPPHLALPGADASPPGQPQEQTPVDDSHAEVDVEPQLKPGGSVSKEEDPKPPHQLYSCRLNPHDQLGRLCVYGIAPTKENTLVLIAVDIGGKNTQKSDQIRTWAAPTAGPETSTVLEDILERWGELWLPARERTLIAVTQEKYILFLCFDVF